MPKDTVSQYLQNVQKTLASGQATEHSYRPPLKLFVESMQKDIDVTNEPKWIQCGAPDLIVTKGKTPLGHIEAKDIGKSLEAIEKDARLVNPKTDDGRQLKRYLESLPNLILTDYLEFRWYIGGEYRLSARLARVGTDGKIKKEIEGVEDVTRLLDQFFTATVPTVGTAKELAARMASLGKLIRGIISQALQDEDKGGTLHDQMQGFKDVLLHSLKPDEFADMYAQTICYGLFAARCNHNGKEPFRREHAAYELPKTNPFMRKLFSHMAGPDLEPRVTWAVDDLAELLNRADMGAILKSFGKRTRQEDPVLHFYETFLAAYDPKMREARGVYYTPEPVVSYIVRSIDHILKEDFGLKDGLADTSKVPVYHTVTDKNGKPQRRKTGECHKVLILDPAVGTGTFLHGVIDHIHEHVVSKGQAGTWSGYVSEHLLPRLFGFELLVAPYAVAHMKLDLQLKETKYDFKADERVNIFLTNTLEETFDVEARLPLMQWLADEANEAGKVKRDVPVMVVLGNPPYSGHSQTPSERFVTIKKGQYYFVESKGSRTRRKATRDIHHKEKTFIGRLIRDYFSVDGKPLGERNPKWLNDDYVKFIRFAQWRIQQTGYGVLAFICNHSYLDNPTFRGMRQNLMNTFDEIYVLDLHGNARKKEVCPDGSKDENVFDIEQGVAIGIFVKRRTEKEEQPVVNHAHLWGLREVLEKDTDHKERLTGGKYFWLYENDVRRCKWTKIEPRSPFYLFVPQSIVLRDEYERGWKITEVMPLNGVGMTTARDHVVIDFDKAPILQRARLFRDSTEPDAELCDHLNIPMKKGWNISNARKLIREEEDLERFLKPVTYRPFDHRFIFYHDSLVWRTVKNVMRHMLVGPNVALITSRLTKGEVFKHAQVTRNIVEVICMSPKTSNNGFVFPLYLYARSEYPQAGENHNIEFDKPTNAPGGRSPNLAPEFISKLSKNLKTGFIPDGKGDLKETFGPEDVFNYMYAFFYSPTYRTRYAEFLKIDFPRLPLTSNRVLFKELCALGEELVALHLMDKHAPTQTSYPVQGENDVDKVRYTEPGQEASKGRVWINRTQYFENVPPEVWNFHIGGYQVCQKWLKDRKGRKLSFDDLQHYQHIVSALRETIRLMSEIDKAIDGHGGWPLK